MWTWGGVEPVPKFASFAACEVLGRWVGEFLCAGGWVDKQPLSGAAVANSAGEDSVTNIRNMQRVSSAFPFNSGHAEAAGFLGAQTIHLAIIRKVANTPFKERRLA